jgi:hypothetical protein
MPQHFSYTEGIVYSHTMMDAVIIDTTSAGQMCAGAKSICLYITEAGVVNNRSGVFTVEISPDGTNFYAYSMLITNTADTNAESLTRVASVTRAAAGTDVVWFTPETLGAIAKFRVKVDVTDGESPVGTYTVKSLINY